MQTAEEYLKDVETFLEEMEAYAKLGFEEIYVMPTGDPVDFVERLEPLIGRLEAL